MNWDYIGEIQCNPIIIHLIKLNTMKLYWYENVIFLPITGTDKFNMGTISGILFNHQWTLDEMNSKYGDKLKQVDNLHELCKEWGTRL